MGVVSDACTFVDSALQREGSPYRADEARDRIGATLSFYGASVGAIRGSIKDVGRRYPHLTHDEIVALSSELWAVPVFERRLAAIVLLQTHVSLLTNFDLTRIEGFLRRAEYPELIDPLAHDVLSPLLQSLDGPDRDRADSTLNRWAVDGSPSLSRASERVRGERAE